MYIYINVINQPSLVAIPIGDSRDPIQTLVFDGRSMPSTTGRLQSILSCAIPTYTALLASQLLTAQAARARAHPALYLQHDKGNFDVNDAFHEREYGDQVLTDTAQAKTYRAANFDLLKLSDFAAAQMKEQSQKLAGVSTEVSGSRSRARHEALADARTRPARPTPRRTPSSSFPPPSSSHRTPRCRKSPRTSPRSNSATPKPSP